MESCEKKTDENNRKKNVIISVLFSVTALTGVMVCLICNIAISGNLTWSLIPVSSIVFAWVILLPGIILGKRGIIVSFILLSVFIIPYLFLLSSLIKIKAVFSVGAAMAAVSIAFLWIIAAVFGRIGKEKKSAALGITFLSAIPFIIIVNIMLSKMIAEPVFDVWDVLSVSLLLILAVVSFACGYAKKTMLPMLPYTAVLVIDFYVLPCLIRDTGTAMLLMLFVMPLILSVCAAAYGVQQGFHFVFPVMAMILFFPTIFLYYNSSALPYIIMYGIAAFAGIGIGCIFHKKSGADKERLL